MANRDELDRVRMKPMSGKRLIWSLLVGIAIIAGCATTSSGGASVSNPGAYARCPAGSYFPNADCYGGAP